MSDDDSAEKELEASQRRLDQAREKGQIARSPDLTTAASYAGLVLAALTMGQSSLQTLGQSAAVLIEQSDGLSRLMLTAGRAPFAGMLAPMLTALAPFFLLPALGAIMAVALQRGFKVTLNNLSPKLSRISPISTAKQKFGRNGLFEFAKSVAKLAAVSAILGVFLAQNFATIIGSLYLPPAQGIASLVGLLVRFLVLILLVATVIGGLDYLWQYFEHLRRNRMSRKEMMDEHKDSEGDPNTKAQRRQRGYDIAMNRMLADVQIADVIVVNPTHFAVALKWDRAAKRAPRCVAKGVDEIAARIREKAAEAGVPIHRDPPTARALYASVELGAEIQPDHYRSVAAAIRFAEAMRKRARVRK